jgi:hypothetical protein
MGRRSALTRHGMVILVVISAECGIGLYASCKSNAGLPLILELLDWGPCISTRRNSFWTAVWGYPTSLGLNHYKHLNEDVTTSERLMQMYLFID